MIFENECAGVKLTFKPVSVECLQTNYIKAYHV